MTNLTVLDIAEGISLDSFGKNVKKRELQQIAQYYVATAGRYFPKGTRKSDYYSRIGSEASEGEKTKYLHDLHLISAQLVKLEQPEPRRLKQAFSENPRLVVSLDNICDKGCLHCVSEATMKKSEKMEYEDITSLDFRYFDIFKTVDFGRKGDPMLWKSDDHDISDIINHFADRHVKEVTIAAGLFKGRDKWYERVTEKLEKVHAKHDNLNLETMLTYHHYFPDMKPEEIALLFNKSLYDCSKFSDKIIISIIGDRAYDASSINAVGESFLENFDKIFKGFDLRRSRNNIIAKKDGKKTVIYIPQPSDAIHPFGRFENKLKNDKIYESYVKTFNEMLSEPDNCPDALSWPGMVIEPNGDINMCGSFEAIAYPNVTVVSNIFKPFEKVEADLLDLYRKERQWFIKNFPDIAFGRKTTCKIKNACYTRY
jgi:hypothetical protein